MAVPLAGAERPREVQIPSSAWLSEYHLNTCYRYKLGPAKRRHPQQVLLGGEPHSQLQASLPCNLSLTGKCSPSCHVQTSVSLSIKQNKNTYWALTLEIQKKLSLGSHLFHFALQGCTVQLRAIKEGNGSSLVSLGPQFYLPPNTARAHF